ncbi:MAG: polyprenyl synthetase family protein [Gaiellales bacterium]
MTETGVAADALAALRREPGLADYLAAVETRLEEVVAGYPGLVCEVATEALAAGGKRLRPMLVYLWTSPGAPPPVAAGAALELVHMATLVHDDIVDGAAVRRGRAAAWSTHGALAAKATGDHLFALAFAELAECGTHGDLAELADASLALARGEAMQRCQRHNADTPVDAYVERVALKTARLFEAACRFGGGEPSFGRDLGIAFQIADDILDCAGDTHETGKIPGTDLRDGTPTLPLLLAAEADPIVRAALAGGPLEGALIRVAASGALERSREVALEFAERARASLDEAPRREALEALTLVVVDRAG